MTSLDVPKLKTAKSFSFADIVESGRDATVRLSDDLLLFAVDLVYVVSESNTRKAAATKLKATLSDDLFPSDKVVYRKFPGSGNDNTCLVTFENAIELIMVLGGKEAKKARRKFANIIKRYLAGDTSLIIEIKSNATSTAPIAQLARASLAADAPVEDTQELVRKRKRDDLELATLELDVQERTEIVKAKSLANRAAEQNIRAAEQNIRAAEIANLNAMTTSYGVLCQDNVMDERARLIFKDYYLNVGMTTGGLICDTAVTPNKPLSVSLVAVQMGLTKLTKLDLMSAGSEIAKRYKEAHDGVAPPKHEQLCDGRMTLVNTYFECDRSIIEDVLRERHCAVPATPAPRPQRNILHHFSPAPRS